MSSFPVEISPRTLRMVGAALSDAFKVPFSQLPRVFYHGLILACIILGFWLLDSLKDPILTNTVGIEYQPIAKLGSVVFTLAVVCVYDFLTSIVSKLTLFHIVSWLFGVVILVFSAILSDPERGLKQSGSYGSAASTEPRYIGFIAYFLIESYGSLMVALFWSFTNSITNLEDAKGAYGLIIALAQIGAVLGSTLATKASNFGIPQLFIIGSMSIFSISLLMKAYFIIFSDRSAFEITHTRVRSASESLYSDASDEGLMHDPALDTMSVTPNPMANLAPHESEMMTLEELKARRDPSYYLEEDDDYESAKSTLSKSQNNFNTSPVSSKINYSEKFYNVVVLFFSGFYEGLVLILQHSYTMKILGVSCLYEIVVTILDYEFKILAADAVAHNSHLMKVTIASMAHHTYSHSEVTPKVDEDKFANLLGHFGQFTNLISLVISFFLFSLLNNRLGVQYTLMIFPAFLFAAVIMVHLVPTLWILFIFVSITKAMVFSLHDPTKELLYNPTSEPIKYKAKAWIDVFGSRLAKALGSLITNYSNGNAIRLQHVSELPCLVLTALLVYLAWSVGRDFQRLVDRKEIVGE